MSTYVLLHFERKNEVTIIIKLQSPCLWIVALLGDLEQGIVNMA